MAPQLIGFIPGFHQFSTTMSAAPEVDSPANPFYSDQAIERIEEDALNREKFAKRLANAIGALPGDESTVIGLYGEWGSGKSSLMNMVLEFLRKNKSTSPDILEFSPWRITDDENLFATFFSEVGFKIVPDTPDGGGEGAAGEAATNRKKLWAKYTKRLAFGATSLEAASTILGLVGVPGSPLLKLAGQALTTSSELSEHAEQSIPEPDETPEESLEDIHKKLRKSLKDADRNLLVVVDDIDRLTADEVQTLIRLVKANLDFPRFIFVLIAAKRHLAKCLDGLAGKGNGGKYLEKIIQIPIEMPQASTDDIRVYFGRKLDALLTSFQKRGVPMMEEESDQRRLGELYREFLRPHFRDLRAVNRLLNASSLSFACFAEEGGFDANPVDLMALDALRTFEPSCYMALLEQPPSSLHGELDDWMSTEESNSEKTLDAVVKGAASKKLARWLVRFLFPPLEQGGQSEGIQNEWRTARRVCTKEYFERYFQLSLRPSDLRDGEIRAILRATSDREKTASYFEELGKEKRLDRFFTTIQDTGYLEGAANRLKLLLAAWDRVGDLPPRPDLLFTRDGYSQLTYLAGSILRSMKNEGERATFLTKFAKKCPSIAGAVKLQRELEHDLTESPHSALCSKDAVDTMGRICLERIQKEAEAGTLVESGLPWTGFIYAWLKWDEPAGKAFIRECLQSADGLKLVLDACKGTISSERTVNYVHTDAVEKIADLDAVEQAANQFGTGADKELAKLIASFRRFLELKRAGKPNDPNSVLSDELHGRT